MRVCFPRYAGQPGPVFSNRKEQHMRDVDGIIDEPDDDDDDTDPEDIGDISAVDIDMEQCIEWAKEIREHEAEAIEIRWHVGQALIVARGDRQRLPKGFYEEYRKATRESKRELMYRIKLAEKFPTRKDLDKCIALHLSWRELIAKHLTGDKSQPPKDKSERPGKGGDGYSWLAGRDVVRAMREELVAGSFSVKAIGAMDESTAVDVVRQLKQAADRIQRRISAIQKNDRSPSPRRERNRSFTTHTVRQGSVARMPKYRGKPIVAEQD
jgi:hypothetical protein